jgi:NADPH2:quinone reductase
MSMAIVVSERGGPEQLRWEGVAPLVPGPGDVLVSNSAVDVNMLDVYHRAGRPHPHRPELPYVPGSVNVGTVAGWGADVADVSAGQRVVGVGSIGGYAQHTLGRADRLVRVPDDLDDVQLAAVFVRGLTAYYLTHQHHAVRAGETVLVQAASGGLGQLLCRWCAALGAVVIGTVSTPAKVPTARAAGCSEVIVRAREDLAGRSLLLTGGRGVDVVYDSIGPDTVRQSLGSLRVGGEAIVCGATSGTVDNFSLEWLHARSLRISRPTLATHIATSEQLRTAASAVFSAMRQGLLKLPDVMAFPLAEAAQAHRALESGAAPGTPVLIP